ncbi:hypothetical protein ACFX1R_046274 [Malus domestica]
MNERTFRWNIEYRPPPEDFPSLQGPAVLGSPTSYEKLGGKVTNEDLQATTVQVLKSMENISLETRGDVSRLCSLTGSLQRILDLEYSTPKDGYAREIMREASPGKEPVIPLFPLLEEGKERGNEKVGPEANQPILKEILETDLPYSLLFSLDSRGQAGQDKKKYGMNQQVGESSGKTMSTNAGKPLPYKPSLANKGGRAR